MSADIFLQGRTCPVCGKTFATARKNQIYCGINCKRAANRKILKSEVAVKKCVVCGKNFETNKPTLILTCSKECSRIRHLQICNKHAKSVTAPLKKCPECGSEFVPYRNSQIYCSDKCRDARRAVRKGEIHKTARLNFKFKDLDYVEIHRDIFRNLLRQIFGHKKEQHYINSGTLDDWICRADACNMSYGKFRAAVEVFGKSFEELQEAKE